MVSWSISAVRLLLMTFVLDHTPSKYVQIEQSTAKYGYIYGVFSRAVPQKSRYFVHSVSTRVLEVRYSCYYVLLVLLFANYSIIIMLHLFKQYPHFRSSYNVCRWRVWLCDTDHSTLTTSQRDRGPSSSGGKQALEVWEPGLSCWWSSDQCSNY